MNSIKRFISEFCQAHSQPQWATRLSCFHVTAFWVDVMLKSIVAAQLQPQPKHQPQHKQKLGETPHHPPQTQTTLKKENRIIPVVKIIFI